VHAVVAFDDRPSNDGIVSQFHDDEHVYQRLDVTE
jgi:hypothetical protein